MVIVVGPVQVVVLVSTERLEPIGTSPVFKFSLPVYARPTSGPNEDTGNRVGRREKEGATHPTEE